VESEKVIRFSLFHYLKMIIKALVTGGNYRRNKFPIFIYFGKRITAYILFAPLIGLCLPIIIYSTMMLFGAEYDSNSFLGLTLLALIMAPVWFLMTSVFLMLTLDDRMAIISVGRMIEINDFEGWKCTQRTASVDSYKGVALSKGQFRNKDYITKHTIDVILKHLDDNYTIKLNASPAMRFRSRIKWFIKDLKDCQKEWSRFLGLPAIDLTDEN
jgi:hypothetical protein